MTVDQLYMWTFIVGGLAAVAVLAVILVLELKGPSAFDAFPPPPPNRKDEED